MRATLGFCLRRCIWLRITAKARCGDRRFPPVPFRCLMLLRQQGLLICRVEPTIHIKGLCDRSMMIVKLFTLLKVVWYFLILLGFNLTHGLTLDTALCWLF